MLLILSSKSQKIHSHKTIIALSHKLTENHVENYVGYFEDISITMDLDKITILIGDRDLREFSSIYFRKVGTNRHVAHILSQFAHKNNIKFIDRFRLDSFFTTKINQCANFSFNNISYPKTFTAGQWNAANIKKALHALQFPIIIKAVGSSQGKGVAIAKNTLELQSKIKKLSINKKQLLLQSFVNNDFEYRILVLGGKAILAETKTRHGNEFRNNISLGATEKFISLSHTPKKVLITAEKAAKAMKIDVAGVDVVVDKETNITYVLEVNPAPQFTLNEEISNELIAITHYLSLWENEKNS
jgi:glutathione synthase/RimK-type ligase-like ATP-grasp enzyme